MILDKRNEFADALALNTGGAATYLLGDQIDRGAVNPIIGAETLYLVVSVDTAITCGTTGTVAFSLASDDTAAISTTTATIHATSRAWATSATAIPAGTVLAVIELPRSATYERYLGILQVTGSAAVSAGKVNAFLTSEPALWVATDSPFQL